MSELQELLRDIVARLDAAGIPFMVAGSFASSAHGMPRTTQDLDLVIAPPGLRSGQSWSGPKWRVAPSDNGVTSQAF